MLDIKFIRENVDLVKGAVQKKHLDVDIDKLLEVNEMRRKLLAEVEEMRSEQKYFSQNIRFADKHKREGMLTEVRTLKEKLGKKEDELKEVMKEWQALMLRVPNIPDMTVPEGKDENENVERGVWGEKPNFSFEPKDHVELLTNLNMVDFQRGTKAHGFRGYFLLNDGALLSWAIWNYARDFFLGKNFAPFLAPAIVRKEHFYGTGHLPGDADDLFQTQDDDYLSGTAEVPMMAYHSDEVIEERDLPKRYLAFSSCFRREAGSYGKDTKGLMRVHEFHKWEQLILCPASHEQSMRFHEELTRNTEIFMESLGLPYRRLEICTGDLKTAHVKSYDTELWIPSQEQYREIASASFYHDFQTRRFGIRYRAEDRRLHFAHSLNATAVPTPRILVAIAECYQNEDGSITIPEVLRKYMGKDKIQ